MKKIINLIFKIHINLFKIPCRAHVRVAIENNYTYNKSWRVGMLYVCGENPGAIAEWMATDESKVIQILNEMTEGVRYE